VPDMMSGKVAVNCCIVQNISLGSDIIVGPHRRAGQDSRVGPDSRFRVEGSLEAIGRIDRSPGRRQGTIPVSTAVRHYFPAAGLFRPLDILDRRRDPDQGRARHVISDATGT
jgi:hypothetical protein